MAQTQGNRLTIELVESRVRGNPHARFGRRPGETERPKRRHRAPSRPHLGGQVVDEVRRRVQQAIHGHRGHKDDPLYGIRNLLRCAAERLTDRQQARLAKAIDADERHVEVFVAWQCAQQLRQVYHQPTSAAGRKLAEKIITSFPSCPVPEIARLGRTLKRWRSPFMAYFDTSAVSNGGTEAICECGGGWSGTGWSGWFWPRCLACDSRSYWPVLAVSFC